jgi:hypothetical protein
MAAILIRSTMNKENGSHEDCDDRDGDGTRRIL